jgi:uncharacterized lipoprotein YddW (UPF0748 family)
MIFTGSRALRLFAGAGVAVCLAGVLPAVVSARRGDRQAEAPPAAEMRAMWVLRSSLASPESIAALVRSARRTGFNTLFVQVRGRGDALFTGSSEPRATELARQPESFDPLADVLQAAHAAGLRVHAWVNVNLVSSAVDLPRSREHLVSRHPEWLMVPRDLGQELARAEPASPGYLGKLARWTRAHATDVEGLYASPINPLAVEHLRGIVRGLARRYPLDGVHFDYARYPSDRFDYSRAAVREFRASMEGRLPAARRRSLAAQEANDIFAYPDAFPDDWRRFRVARMTTLLARLRDAVKAERPGAVVSVAIKPDKDEALQRRLQEWPRWLERGLVDAVAPMAYTTEPARFAEQIAAARAAAGTREVWAGIGAYRLSAAQTIDNIATARRLGAGGIILFSYDSLVDPRKGAEDYLAAVSRGAFAPLDAGSR